MARRKIRAMLRGLCPQCRIGQVFSGNPYSLHRQRINEVCNHCGLRFEIEPGYFYAALYVSYAIVVLELLITAVLLYYFTKSDSPWVYLGVFAGVILGLAPINFRLGRLVLLYYLTPKIKYQARYKKDYSA